MNGTNGNGKIKQGTVVNLAYSLKNDEGQVLDQTDTNQPFTYLHGAQQIVPGLENELEGLTVGQKKQVTVAPEQGYGEVNPELKVSVKRSQFPEGVEIEPGMQFATETPDGQNVVFTVANVQGEQITIDGNHPLAGQTLHFDVEVLDVRDATKEEMAHGHAHGPGGHDH